MAINLQKGQRESINAPKFTVGFGIYLRRKQKIVVR